MTNQQILWLWSKVKKYFNGVPDPDQYIWEIGDLWESIKERQDNREAFRMLVIFRNILDAASKEGVEL